MARQQVALAVVLCLLAGCATKPPIERIVVREVKVPVPVARVVPDNLSQCGTVRPAFRFYATIDPEYRVGIRSQDEILLRNWVDEKDRCLQAWQTWSRTK